MMFCRKLCTALFLLLPLVVACESQNRQSIALASEPVVLGLIPAEQIHKMEQRFEPMRAYLEQKLGRRVEFFTATSYGGIIEGMKQDKVDLAFFGPLSYVLAEEEAGAEAFAVGVRYNGKSTYHSIFVAPRDSSIKSLEDLQGKSVAFVDPASTSGALMPTYAIKKATGMMPKEFFGELTYAGSHDRAEIAVKYGTVDAAADSDISYDKMLEKGFITKQTNLILWRSDPLPGSPLTYREDLDPRLKAQLREIILNAHQEIEVTGFGELIRYEATEPANYQVIRDMIKELGIEREEMLK
ncbi:phosphonate ABC transporter substrate-binding protein [Phormidium sp. CCY1219]|uniref:phosphonate ABC transporter substrate-binding protein n=1 Tax=Phormidium sp. CCY1219 TaxID=2886104 RepID=UPI002D1EAFE7|nr:phosphonate ABC transporter substrate-binding protein [Phormidium sp. CCY1219]MEB3827078.1 phosphonate ABC transporter substrate-binding protein [Phormidium sp. CCY1219]